MSFCPIVRCSVIVQSEPSAPQMIFVKRDRTAWLRLTILFRFHPLQVPPLSSIEATLSAHAVVVEVVAGTTRPGAGAMLVAVCRVAHWVTLLCDDFQSADI